MLTLQKKKKIKEKDFKSHADKSANNRRKFWSTFQTVPHSAFSSWLLLQPKCFPGFIFYNLCYENNRVILYKTLPPHSRIWQTPLGEQRLCLHPLRDHEVWKRSTSRNNSAKSAWSYKPTARLCLQCLHSVRKVVLLISLFKFIYIFLVEQLWSHDDMNSYSF